MGMGKTSARKYRRQLRELEHVQVQITAELRGLGYEVRGPDDLVAAVKDLVLQAKGAVAPVEAPEVPPSRDLPLIPMRSDLELDLGFDLGDLDASAEAASAVPDMEEIGRQMKAKAEAKLAGMAWQGGVGKDDPGQVTATEGLKTVREQLQRP